MENLIQLNKFETNYPHTHCQAAHAAHVQSQPISVLSAVQADKVVNEKCPTARLNYKGRYTINGGQKRRLRMRFGQGPYSYQQNASAIAR